MGKNKFCFPQQRHVEAVKEALATIIGSDSFKASMHKDGVWEAEIYFSTGELFEKATVARVDLCGGSVEGARTDITLVQSFVWPVNPFIPGLILMASASSTEVGDPIITFFTDLIMQAGEVRQEDKDVFTSGLAAACQLHAQDINEYQALMAGRGMLGGCAAECGMLYFFEESDAGLLEDLINAALSSYQSLVRVAPQTSLKDDYATMRENHRKIIDWITTQDYGFRVSRENGIPLSVIKAYGFPPTG